MLNNKVIRNVPRLNSKLLRKESLQSIEAVFVMVDAQCEILTSKAGIGLKPVQCSGVKSGGFHPTEPQREKFNVPDTSAEMCGWTTMKAWFTNNLIYKDFLFVLNDNCFLVWFFKYTAMRLLLPIFPPKCLNILSEVTTLKKKTMNKINLILCNSNSTHISLNIYSHSN